MTGEPEVSQAAPSAPFALIPLGDANAVVCDGDVCYVPAAATTR